MTKKLPISKAKTAYGLLSEVRALILAEPLRYNQGRYIARVNGINDADSGAPGGFPSCGTVGCVAGWVATLQFGRKFTYGLTSTIASKTLGIDSEQAYELFTAGAVSGEPQTAKYAREGERHIAKFQKKYRAQLLGKKLRNRVSAYATPIGGFSR